MFNGHGGSFLRSKVDIDPPTSEPHVLQAVLFSYCAAASLISWETIITIRDEVQYIWSKPNNAYAKWMYLFAKWFGFAHQIAIFFSFLILVDRSPTPIQTCRAFHFYQAGALLFLFTNLDVLLLLRVHALYQQKARYTIIAVILFSVQFVSSLISNVDGVARSPEDTSCIIVSVPSFSLAGTICLGISQAIFLTLAFRKRSVACRGKRGTIVWVVFRDSFFVFAAMIGLAILSLIYLLTGPAAGNVLYPWFPTLPALLTSRLIVNMQKTADSEETGVVELTTAVGTSSENQGTPLYSIVDCRSNPILLDVP